MSTRADRERELRAESRRLKAALSAIHNALHANAVDQAHELCECALSGEEVSQPNLSADNSAKAMTFAADFNRLAERAGVRACCVVAMPSATVAGATSLQLLGEVGVCKVVEQAMRGAESTYMGDHEHDREASAYREMVSALAFIHGRRGYAGTDIMTPERIFAWARELGWKGRTDG